MANGYGAFQALLEPPEPGLLKTFIYHLDAGRQGCIYWDRDGHGWNEKHKLPSTDQLYLRCRKYNKAGVFCKATAHCDDNDSHSHFDGDECTSSLVESSHSNGDAQGRQQGHGCTSNPGHVYCKDFRVSHAYFCILTKYWCLAFFLVNSGNSETWKILGSPLPLPCNNLLTKPDMLAKDDHILGDIGYICTERVRFSLWMSLHKGWLGVGSIIRGALDHNFFQVLIPYRNTGPFSNERSYFNRMISEVRSGVHESFFSLVKGRWRRAKDFESRCVEYAVETICLICPSQFHHHKWRKAWSCKCFGMCNVQVVRHLRLWNNLQYTIPENHVSVLGSRSGTTPSQDEFSVIKSGCYEFHKFSHLIVLALFLIALKHTQYLFCPVRYHIPTCFLQP